MLSRNRILTVFLATSYLLAVSASALFHDHGEHGEDQARPGVSSSHPGDDQDCSVCQFLAQKPAPLADAAPSDFSALVQRVAPSAPECIVGGLFSAWQSRAPPVLA
jgi:Protein of unknown function (DUF2946)